MHTCMWSAHRKFQLQEDEWMQHLVLTWIFECVHRQSCQCVNLNNNTDLQYRYCLSAAVQHLEPQVYNPLQRAGSVFWHWEQSLERFTCIHYMWTKHVILHNTLPGDRSSGWFIAALQEWMTTSVRLYNSEDGMNTWSWTLICIFYMHFYFYSFPEKMKKTTFWLWGKY